MNFMRKTQEGLDPTNFPERFDAASALNRFGEVTECEDGMFSEGLRTQTYMTVMWSQEGLVKYDLDSSCQGTFQLAKRWARLLGRCC